MSTCIARIFVIIAVIAAFSGAAALAEQIDNSMYGYWANFKPGSVLKTTTDSVAAGQKSTMDTPSCLRSTSSQYRRPPRLARRHGKA